MRLKNDTELEQALAMLGIVDKTIDAVLGGRMDPVQADLNRHLRREEDAVLIRERAENAVLRRFEHCGPERSEVIEAMSEISQLHFALLRKHFKEKDDATLGRLVRKLIEDQAIEDEIEASGQV